MAIPEFATHYHLAGTRPFRNLTELADDDVSAVLRELAALAASGGSHRRFGGRYMDLRRATEQRLRELFVERGGAPERLSPHYFVLGESQWFRGLYGSNAAEIRIPLVELPSAVTSITYPDSFVAMGLLPAFGIETEPQPYHGQVFRLEELGYLVDRYGLPAQTGPTRYDGYQRRADEHFIEIQLWSDAALTTLELPTGAGPD